MASITCDGPDHLRVIDQGHHRAIERRSFGERLATICAYIERPAHDGISGTNDDERRVNKIGGGDDG